jgi:dTDP-glucose 4,6-dehydratase
LRKGATGQAYNIGADNEKENLEVIHAILERVDKPRTLIRHVEDRPGHDRRYGIDTTRIQQELGWSPSRDWLQTLHDTIDWYVDNPSWWQAIRDHDPRFQQYYDRQYAHRLANVG